MSDRILSIRDANVEMSSAANSFWFFDIIMDEWHCPLSAMWYFLRPALICKWVVTFCPNGVRHGGEAPGSVCPGLRIAHGRKGQCSTGSGSSKRYLSQDPRPVRSMASLSSALITASLPMASVNQRRPSFIFDCTITA